jgi:hypothetical protein
MGRKNVHGTFSCVYKVINKPRRLVWASCVRSVTQFLDYPNNRSPLVISSTSLMVDCVQLLEQVDSPNQIRS